MRFLTLVTLLALPQLVHAADVPVRYLVNDAQLKTAVAGTSLTFSLYTDPTCSGPAHASSALAIENATVTSRLKVFKAKGATTVPAKTDEIVWTMPNVPPTGQTLYLKVTGTGITPVGPACQVQAGTAPGTLGALNTYTGLIQNYGYGNGWVFVSTSFGGSSGYLPRPVDRSAAVTVAGLNPGQAYDCTFTYPGNPPCNNDGFCDIFDAGCTVHAGSCSDGIKDDGEINSDCGGPCSPCGDGALCNVNADCQSNQCELNTSPCGSPGFKVCIPAHCFDSIQDNGESGIDCGLACGLGCATGLSCSGFCDCQSGHGCVSGTCN
jgi:hypothetical protein